MQWKTKHTSHNQTVTMVTNTILCKICQWKTTNVDRLQPIVSRIKCLILDSKLCVSPNRTRSYRKHHKCPSSWQRPFIAHKRSLLLTTDLYEQFFMTVCAHFVGIQYHPLPPMVVILLIGIDLYKDRYISSQWHCPYVYVHCITTKLQSLFLAFTLRLTILR